MSAIPRRYWLLLCVAAAAVALSGRRVDAAGVVFRYLPGSAELSSTIESRFVEAGPFLDPRERKARWPSGWGYDPIWAAEFDGASSVLWSSADSSLNQPAGPRVTVEVWMRLLELGDHHTLLTNRIGARDGFTLGLDQGVPYFTLVNAGIAYRVAATEEIVAGEDVWLAATAEYSFSNTLRLSIYRDGQLVHTASMPATFTTPYVIPRPFFVGTDAAGTVDAPTLTGTLAGLLFAAIVRDYVAHPAYLNTSPPFDGSAYFGLPAFHDYDVRSFQLPMDQRIDTYPTSTTHRYYLPHVNDAFIPQGVATVSDDLGQPQLVYVSYYHRTRDNRLTTKRSIVVEIDVTTGRLRRTFRLKGALQTAHVGGLAFVDGALYVASAGLLERYPIPAFEEGSGRYIDLEPDTQGSKNVRGKASFVSTFADTLWVGDYRTESQPQPYLYGYPLDETGLPVPGANPVVYPIPRRIQGVDFFTLDHGTFVFMARNRNSREAEVLRLRRSDLRFDSPPVWESSTTFPHGIEDLSFSADGTLWTNSESGTDFYQRTAGWSSFYPFVYGVALSELLLGVENMKPFQVALPELQLEVYPNPAADQLHISYVLDKPEAVHLQVIDLLGRRVKKVVYPAHESGTHRLTLMVDHLASGAYVLVLEAAGRQVRQPIVLVH